MYHLMFLNITKHVNSISCTFWWLGNKPCFDLAMIMRKKMRSKQSHPSFPFCYHLGPWTWFFTCFEKNIGTLDLRPKLALFSLLCFIGIRELFICDPWLYCCSALLMFRIFLSFVLLCMFYYWSLWRLKDMDPIVMNLRVGLSHWPRHGRLLAT